MNKVDDVLSQLEQRGSKRTADGLARYGIVAEKVYGVSVAEIRAIARPYRHDHALALALWDTGWYEARMMTAFVDDPRAVTPAQMDRWARDFDNWAITDALTFHLFDKTPYAWAKVEQWRTRRGEFVKRGAFALLAALALHDKKSPDTPFLAALPWIEDASTDDRNFVRKGVSWALRSYVRRGPEAREAARALAERLASSDHRTARWIGKDALRDLAKNQAK